MWWQLGCQPSSLSVNSILQNRKMGGNEFYFKSLHTHYIFSIKPTFLAEGSLVFLSFVSLWHHPPLQTLPWFSVGFDSLQTLPAPSCETRSTFLSTWPLQLILVFPAGVVELEFPVSLVWFVFFWTVTVDVAEMPLDVAVTFYKPLPFLLQLALGFCNCSVA